MTNFGLVVLSLVISLVMPEIGYRVYLAVSGRYAPDSWFHLAQTTYGHFDAEFGQKFVPGSSLHFAIVRNGTVIACLGDVFAANIDGLGGATTIADYASADLKVVLTGDSFSHWRLGGLTIADKLQRELTAATGRRVAVLNFARGGYGLLQMISMAAAQAERTKPALIVVAFITDDLTRGRWWSKAAVIEGRARQLIAARPEDLDNTDKANDEYVVDPRATADWCEERRHRGDRDDVLLEANAFYESYVKRKDLRPGAFAVDRAYFYAMLWRRLTGAELFPKPSTIPRIDADEFANDARYRADRDTLRRLRVPIIFLHLPLREELAAGRPLPFGEPVRIWSTIEDDFNTKAVTYFDLKHRPTLPAVFNLEPFDNHPNAAGIAFYGKIAFGAVAERHLIDGFTEPDYLTHVDHR